MLDDVLRDVRVSEPLRQRLWSSFPIRSFFQGEERCPRRGSAVRGGSVICLVLGCTRLRTARILKDWNPTATTVLIPDRISVPNSEKVTVNVSGIELETRVVRVSARGCDD